MPHRTVFGSRPGAEEVEAVRGIEGMPWLQGTGLTILEGNMLALGNLSFG